MREQNLLDHVMLTAYIAELAEWDNRAHLERIRRYAYLLAVGAGFGHDEAELLSVACLLHDIGKITQPVAILSKTSRLEPEEYKIAERHAQDGARLLAGSDSAVLQTAEAIALTHHERWDGSGYPNGLSGEAIPMTGRIMAVADVFDALTTWRSYKAVIEPEAALGLIETSSRTLFDPKLVSVFVDRFPDFKAVLHSHDPKLAGPR